MAYKSALTGVSLAVATLLSPQSAAAQTYNLFDYWLQPATQVSEYSERYHNGQIQTGGQRVMWRGTLSGRTVALVTGPQLGDYPGYANYDIFTEEADYIAYWGTFGGNFYPEPPPCCISTWFWIPHPWGPRSMTVGQVIEHSTPTQVLDPKLRRVTSAPQGFPRTRLDAHYDTWTDPDSGILWTDLLRFSYWPVYDPQDETYSLEIYWIPRGLGFVRYEHPQPDSDPASQWVTRIFTQPQGTLHLPWYDPFEDGTFLTNGFFEDMITSPVNAGLVWDYLRGWSANNTNAKITTDTPVPPGEHNSGTGPWKIAIIGSFGGGLPEPSVAYPIDCIPVVPGATYRLSGWILRSSGDDNAYLDFDDGVACSGGNFADGHALATTTIWEKVEATVTVGATTTGIRIRAVRDGANVGNAYYDGLMLQRLN